VPELSKEYLKELCKTERMRNNDVYGTPSLNDKLYLHYKGFRKIQALEEYTGLRCLWLEGNGIDELGGLDHQPELRTLYLHENCIHEIKGLDLAIELNTLNLCKNFVSRLSGLEKCQKLQTLLIAHNHLQTKEDIEHVLKIPTIVTLDMQHNRLEDGPGVLEVVSAMRDLRVLYLMGNPCVKGIRYYRKTVIAHCKELRYLDDRPVFDDERRRVMAWKSAYDATGDYDKANEAERDELKAMRAEKAALEEANFRAFDAMVKEGLHERAEREAVVAATQAAYEARRLEEGDEGEEVKRGELLAGDGVLKKEDLRGDVQGYHGKLTNEGEPVLTLKPETPSLKAARLARRAKIMGGNDAPAAGSDSGGSGGGGFFAAGATPEGNQSDLKRAEELKAADKAASEEFKALVSGDIWADEEVAVVAPNFKQGLEDILGVLKAGSPPSSTPATPSPAASLDPTSKQRIDEVLAAAKEYAKAAEVVGGAPGPMPPLPPSITEIASASNTRPLPAPPAVTSMMLPPPPPLSGSSALPLPSTTDFDELD